MLTEPQNWTVDSGVVAKFLLGSSAELIRKMREHGTVSSASREIIAQMSIPEDGFTQVLVTPVHPDVSIEGGEVSPLWVAIAIFLDCGVWIKRMTEMGVRQIVVMHPEQTTKAGKGRLAVRLDFREVKDFDGKSQQEVVWEISMVFSGGENQTHARLAQAHEEASFFGIPLSHLGQKPTPEDELADIRKDTPLSA